MAEQKRLWVERNEDGTLEAYSSTGAHITFGRNADLFNPGELIQIALAGCAVLSSQSPVNHTLDTAAPLRAEISGVYNKEENRYDSFSETVTTDASQYSLTDDDAEQLKKRLEAFIDKQCTVARTCNHGAPVDITVQVKH
ncbi:MAG: OsmC family protein [Aeriscardovia sp.]|nr:OsmC family protein [Aeriscardovia sp.]